MSRDRKTAGTRAGAGGGYARGAVPLLALTCALALLISGCLPSSGRRNDRSMSPADSASIAFAETVPTDTLTLGWEAAARPDDLMPLPTTIGWANPEAGAGARLVVVETQGASLRLFTPSGRPYRHIDTGGGAESYPYLAGVRGDTAVVLERGTQTLAFVPLDSSGAVRRIPVPAGANAALATATALYVRTGGGAEGETPTLLRLDARGRVASRHAFRGQPWRAAGFLRPWGDRVVALSGYRPVVDVLAAGAATGSRLDTLVLRGFSSPEMPRSSQFMRGDVEQPPLLTSSAAALAGRLFVVNMRDEHVRVDVYGPNGTLQRVLVTPRPWSSLVYIPIDIAVRRVGSTVEIAVLLQRPSGVIQTADNRVVLYRWADREAR